MDDITIYSKTHKQHHKDVKEILKLLSDNGLKLNKAKCNFCTEKVNLLEFTVHNGVVSPNDDRLGPLKTKLNIETIKQLHSFVGYIGYFRNFIKNFAKKTFELYEVINRKKEFKYVDVEGIVESLRVELVNSAFVDFPDMEQQFIIEADASDYCIRGILKQKKDGKEIVIRFYSRNLITEERNYATLEKETLAIIDSIKVFKNYLHKKFLVRTDHKPLVWLHKVKNPQGRIARWLMFLADLDFQLSIKKENQM
jgi:hypothetical protein